MWVVFDEGALPQIRQLTFRLQLGKLWPLLKKMT